MSAVGYRGGVAPPCLRPAACLESGCRGEGGGGLDRLERGWVDAHAELGVERDGPISPVWQVEFSIQDRRAWLSVCVRVVQGGIPVLKAVDLYSKVPT